MQTFDAVVIGAGSGGLTAPRRLALAGKYTALIEADRLGGDCLNWGCVPTKALVATAKLRHQISRAGEFGLHTGDPTLDFPAVMARKAAVQAEIGAEERRYYIAEPAVEVIHGTASFVDAHTIRVDQEELRFRWCIIATGSRPQLPAMPGLAETDCLTNVSILQLDHLPASLAVIGGGPIGCEFAQVFRRFGSHVTLLQRGERLLPREEPEASTLLAQVFEREGIAVRLGAGVQSAERRGDLHVLHAAVRGQDVTVEAEAVLVAAGRLPNVETLNLEAASIRTNEHGIDVDAHMRTTAPDIWAIGDVAGGYKFTHVASDQGWIAAGRALGKRGSFRSRAVPWCTFTDPEVARVGLTEAQARRRYGDKVRVLLWPFRHVDRALTLGEDEGFIKIVTAPGWMRGLAGGEVVGAQIVGPVAGELISELTLLMANHLPLGLLARAIHVYPTLSLGVRQAAAQVWEAAPAQRTSKTGTL